MLNELEILRTVFSERKPDWGGRVSYTYAQFRSDAGIEPSSSMMNDSALSIVLSDRPRGNERSLLGVISGDDDHAQVARNNIESALGLEGLFSCRNRMEILELIRRVDKTPEGSPRLVSLARSAEDDFGLTKPERKAAGFLLEELRELKQPLLHWDAPFDSGASIVAHNVVAELGERKPYDQAVVIRPSDFTRPYEAELRVLADRLDPSGLRICSKRKLADAIIAEGLLLIVLSPFVLDTVKEDNSMRQLVREFARRSDWTGSSNMLVVGNSAWVGKHAGKPAGKATDKLGRLLKIQNPDAFAEFRRQWERFSTLRDNIRSEESGSRMRRAATYYSYQNPEASSWPISIKLRALFTSNYSTSAYLDPTQGFARLAGSRYAEYADVGCFYQDVLDYIEYAGFLGSSQDRSTGARDSHNYLLQYVSTTKHWLTDIALKDLLDKFEGIRRHKLDLKTEKKRMATLNPVIREDPETVNGVRRSRYFAGLGVKAVVQDHWIRSDPFGRSLAHFRMAGHLKRNENNKEYLVKEFPYEPHWGRSRLFFISEAIRHLVRSAETYSGPKVRGESPSGLDFPKPPKRPYGGTDPAEVINYCYETLYQRELNGNGLRRAGRSLAKRHGAYQLAVELLELLSEGNEIGEPHPALKVERRFEFMRECGFALLDIGDLQKAKRCFERARDEADAAGRNIDIINSSLDLILIDCTAGRLKSARRTLTEAQGRIEALHSSYREAEASYEEYRKLRRLFRRLLAREAHLVYLEGGYEAALGLIEKITREDRWPSEEENPAHRVLVPDFARILEAEQVHLLLAAMHKRQGAGKGEEGPIVLNRCLKAMLQAQSEGLQHQAMGFRIVLARCFRRMGLPSAAETILDTVHDDLLRYGCSERTFLAFLNEAGRVLTDLSDPIRAYATYLRPCIVRARARGFRRDAQQAAAHAKVALQQIHALFERYGDAAGDDGAGWSALLDAAKEKQRKLVTVSEQNFHEGTFGRDPLFAYAIADAEIVIDELRGLEQISRHIHDVDIDISAIAPE